MVMVNPSLQMLRMGTFWLKCLKCVSPNPIPNTFHWASSRNKVSGQKLVEMEELWPVNCIASFIAIYLLPHLLQCDQQWIFMITSKVQISNNPKVNIGFRLTTKVQTWGDTIFNFWPQFGLIRNFMMKCLMSSCTKTGAGHTGRKNAIG